jgi:hypothetical protein
MVGIQGRERQPQDGEVRMTYDDWKTESPEDEYCRLNRRKPSKYDDSPEADAYWDAKIDEAREAL